MHRVIDGDLDLLVDGVLEDEDGVQLADEGSVGVAGEILHLDRVGFGRLAGVHLHLGLPRDHLSDPADAPGLTREASHPSGHALGDHALSGQGQTVSGTPERVTTASLL